MNRVRRSGGTPGNQLCWHAAGQHANNCSSTPSGATTYSYDANGNLTGASNGLDLAYNALNQTTSIDPAGSDPAVSFAYADEGQSERTQAGTTAFTNTLLGTSLQSDTSATLRYTRGDDGKLLGLRHSSAGSRYPLFNHLGSIVALTTAAGGESNRYDYIDPYGDDVDVFNDTSTGIANPWRFAGEYRDPQTGYYKIGARYYQPTIGRWTQRDPLNQAFSPRQANRYAYASCDPLNQVDPSGHLSVSFTGEEAIANALTTVAGFALCTAATAATSATATPAAGAVVAAGCYTLDVWGGISLGIDFFDSDPGYIAGDLF